MAETPMVPEPALPPAVERIDPAAVSAPPTPTPPVGTMVLTGVGLLAFLAIVVFLLQEFPRAEKDRLAQQDRKERELKYAEYRGSEVDAVRQANIPGAVTAFVASAKAKNALPLPVAPKAAPAPAPKADAKEEGKGPAAVPMPASGGTEPGQPKAEPNREKKG